MDLSNIDRMELRQRIIELDKTRAVLLKAADDEYEGRTPSVNVEYDAEVERLLKAKNDVWDKASEAFKAGIAALDAKFPGLVKAATARDALDEHDNAPEYSEVNDFDAFNNVVCCVLSGLPILDNDLTVEDGDGRKALALLIPGWPKPAPNPVPDF